jgi:hypothetical protein
VVDAYADLRLAVRRIVILALFGECLRARADELGDLLQGALDSVNLPLHHRLVRIDRPFTRYGRAMPRPSCLRVHLDQGGVDVEDDLARARRSPPTPSPAPRRAMRSASSTASSTST